MRNAFCMVFLLMMTGAAAASDSSVAVPRMNQMNGTVQSIDTDSRVLRVAVEDGMNVEFTYSSQTQLSDRDQPAEMGDLSYGDRVIVKYEGRELIAKRIERLEKAPRILPAPSELLSSSPVVPANQPTN